MLVLSAISLIALYTYLGLKKPAIAVITLPFVTGTLIFIGIGEESIWSIVAACILFVVTLLVLLTSESDSNLIQWPRKVARFLLLSIVFLLFFSLIGYLIYLSIEERIFWPYIVSIGLFFLLIFIIGMIIYYESVTHNALVTYITSTISSIIRQNLPLSMALESAAGGLRDRRSAILKNIQVWLFQGYPLSESIKRGYPNYPSNTIAMIASAEKLNQLQHAMNAIESDMLTKAGERRRIRPVHPIYPIFLIIFMLTMLIGLMIYVMPKFLTTLTELTGGGTYPPATQTLVNIMEFVMVENGWITGLILGLFILIFVLIFIHIRSRPRRPDRPYLISRMGDFIKYHLPILHFYEKNYSLVQVIELLRLSLNAGCTVNKAIENTLDLDVNNCFRKRLQKWLERIERGENIAESARKSKLGPVLAWAFDDKINHGNTPAILETLESLYRSNYSYYVNLARFIMWPCITLAMGAVVGFVIIAIYYPAIEIINSLSGSVVP